MPVSIHIYGEALLTVSPHYLGEGASPARDDKDQWIASAPPDCLRPGAPVDRGRRWVVLRMGVPLPDVGLDVRATRPSRQGFSGVFSALSGEEVSPPGVLAARNRAVDDLDICPAIATVEDASCLGPSLGTLHESLHNAADMLGHEHDQAGGGFQNHPDLPHAGQAATGPGSASLTS